jgi:hypothetical protein
MLKTSHQNITMTAIERLKIQSAFSITCLQIPHTTFTNAAIYAGEIAKG